MAREAGLVCFDSCPEPGREDCHCDCNPRHPGNMHWCFGLGTHAPHQWPVVGTEVPVRAIKAEEVQCPTCKTIFGITEAHIGTNVVVISEAQRLELPFYKPKPVPVPVEEPPIGNP